jgi:hypothetical protein
MAVKVDDADGAIFADYTSQQRKSNCVVATERDKSWKGFPFLGPP